MNNLIHQDDLNPLIQNGGTVHDRSGEQIGTLGRFYVPDGTHEAAWVTLAPGLFSTSETFIPLDSAWIDGLALYVTFSREKIEAAPRQNRDGVLTGDEARELVAYYGAP
ncbi:hypothetical protein [Arthrobacter sp. ERGS1:01]|uniref:hypothetical protein n=1 Tax=Arthrobacter sp. ERGS1:01 TaxID=1704044 RepID=UPI0006B417BA|nr:hypothetical protein [Arthrobacter sp. ERGS1:01]